jgi:hypothetical protein
MNRFPTTRGAAAAIAVGVAVTGTATALGAAGATRSATATPLGAPGAAPPTQTRCPHRAQPLPPAAVAPASRAALRSQRERYAELGTRPLVTRAALAQFDDARGPQARRECGRRVERRTVVVYLDSASAAFRRRNPSLSQGVVFVSRFPGGTYRVWRVVR